MARFTFNGEDIYAPGYDLKKLRQKVGLVFQHPEHQLLEVDVLSDVCFGPKNQGLSVDEAKERAKEALHLWGLDESYYEKSPFELSRTKEESGHCGRVGYETSSACSG